MGLTRREQKIAEPFYQLLAVIKATPNPYDKPGEYGDYCQEQGKIISEIEAVLSDIKNDPCKGHCFFTNGRCPYDPVCNE